LTLIDLKQRLRDRSEYVLRLAAMKEVGERYPTRVTKAALPHAGAFWRYVFVPLYQRVPWSFKRDAMRRLKMVAAGWPEDARRFGEPWRPPSGAEQVEHDADLSGRRDGSGRPQEAPSAER
jgi:hypothetical protein